MNLILGENDLILLKIVYYVICDFKFYWVIFCLNL